MAEIPPGVRVCLSPDFIAAVPEPETTMARDYIAEWRLKSGMVLPEAPRSDHCVLVRWDSASVEAWHSRNLQQIA